MNQRRLAAVAAVLVVALAGPARAEAADDAATINDTGVSVDEFEQFVAALPEAGFSDFATDELSSTVGAEPGRAALTLLVTNEAHRQFFAGLGLAAPTEDERDAAMASTAAEDPVRQVPVVYDAVADNAAYRARLDALPVPETEILREQYETSPTSLGVYCATAVLVAERDDADAIIETYESEDTTVEAVAASVGATVADWQCAPLTSVTDPALRESLLAAEPGEAIGPVATSEGFAVVVIDSFDEAAPKLENFFLRLEESGQTPGPVLFQGFLGTSDITVAPRYGRWDPTTGSVIALGT